MHSRATWPMPTQTECSWRVVGGGTSLDAAPGEAAAAGASAAAAVVPATSAKRLASRRWRRMGSSESAAVKQMKSALAHVKPTPAPSACASSFSVCPLSIAMHDGGATPASSAHVHSKKSKQQHTRARYASLEYIAYEYEHIIYTVYTLYTVFSLSLSLSAIHRILKRVQIFTGARAQYELTSQLMRTVSSFM